MARPKVQQTTNGAAELWGAELLFWRGRCGMTQGALAVLVHCDQSWISSLENGRGTATPELARAFDDVLETGGVLLRSLKYVDREATAAYHPDFFRKYVGVGGQGADAQRVVPVRLPGAPPGRALYAGAACRVARPDSDRGAYGRQNLQEGKVVRGVSAPCPGGH